MSFLGGGGGEGGGCVPESSFCCGSFGAGKGDSHIQVTIKEHLQDKSTGWVRVGGRVNRYKVSGQFVKILVVLVCRESLVLRSHFLCSSLLIRSSKTDHKLLRHLVTHNYVL